MARIGVGVGFVISGNALVPPLGFVFLVDADGAYLIDSDGSYLIGAI